MTSLALATLALALTQAPPTGDRSPIDPFLWPAVLEPVARAAEAERDPKRGPGNAMQILSEALEHVSSDRHRTALRLRLAGTALRQRFSASDKFPEPIRRAQALSTYSRLDLFEPGLKASLRAAIEAEHSGHEGEAHDEEPLVLKAAVLGRSSSVEPAPFKAILQDGFQRAGARIEWVAPKEADYVLELGVIDNTVDDEVRQVTVTLDMKQVEGGKTTWHARMFNTSAAPSFDAGLKAAYTWLGHLGGRDLLFHALAEGPVPGLNALSIPGMPNQAPAHAHRH